MRREAPAKWGLSFMEGRQEGVESLDRAYDLSSLSGEVGALGRGDRSMQQRRAGRYPGRILTSYMKAFQHPTPSAALLHPPISARSSTRLLAIGTKPTASRAARCQGSWRSPGGSQSGGGRRLAGLARAARARRAGRRGGGPGLAPTLLQRLAHTRQLQVAVVLLGDIELLRRAVRVADRQLIGLTRGDLGLVEVRNVHCDRLGAQPGLLSRPIGDQSPTRRQFGQRYPEQYGTTYRC